MTEPAPPPAGRAGIVAVVGRASVGKSTLVNSLLGEKVSIVSPVPQTTRNVVRGILTEPRGQLVFLDTPGVHRARSNLGRLMNRAARAAADGVDAVLLVADGSTPPRMEDEGWMRRLAADERPVLVALNKTDRPDDHRDAYRHAWAAAADGAETAGVRRWAEVSAAAGLGIEELTAALFALVPEGPALFPADVLTDFPRKLAMADTIREQFFGALTDELPHAMAVRVDRVDEAEDGWQAEATVFVKKNSQKPIVLGRKGRLLKRVREAAERELADVYDRPVTLTLWVVVDKDWDRNFWTLRKLGYA